MSSPAAFQLSAFQNNAFQTIPAPPPVGPMAGAIGATVLTNKPSGPPGKYFTKKQKEDFLFGIYQDGLLAKRRFDGLSELERAELELNEAESAQQDAADKLKISYRRPLYDKSEDAADKVRSLQNKVDTLRAAEAGRKALDDARAKIKKQMSDAIAKIRKGPH